MRWVLTVLLIAACGRQSIDPEFQDYINRFENEAAARGVAAHVASSVQFGSVPTVQVNGASTKAYAVCVRGFLGAGTVLVDENQWHGRNDQEHEEVIFHELGHCTLGLAHDTKEHFDDRAAGDIPESIMFPDALALDGVYRDHRTAYLDQLFGKN